MFIGTSGNTKILYYNVLCYFCVIKEYDYKILHIYILDSLFIRLTIPLAFSIGFVAAIAPYLSSGPVFTLYRRSVEGCEKYGWFNILYMNIYQDIMKPGTPGVSFGFQIFDFSLFSRFYFRNPLKCIKN